MERKRSLAPCQAGEGMAPLASGIIGKRKLSLLRPERKRSAGEPGPEGETPYILHRFISPHFSQRPYQTGPDQPSPLCLP